METAFLGGVKNEPVDDENNTEETLESVPHDNPDDPSNPQWSLGSVTDYTYTTTTPNGRNKIAPMRNMNKDVFSYIIKYIGSTEHVVIIL